MSKIESLIKERKIGYYYRWGPKSVLGYEKYLSHGFLREMQSDLRKNIAYSLQYLEFLQLELSELKLHSIIESQIMKSYIVVTMGIVEGLFYFLLRAKDKYKKETWEQKGEVIHTNSFTEDGIKKKYLVSTYIELKAPKDGEMDFEAMINKVQDLKLITISGRKYPYLKELKRLRNRVHLHIGKDTKDTDYKKITIKNYLFSRYILYNILIDEKINGNNIDVFDFLKLNEDELKILKQYYSKLFD